MYIFIYKKETLSHLGEVRERFSEQTEIYTNMLREGESKKIERDNRKGEIDRGKDENAQIKRYRKDRKKCITDEEKF